MRVQSRSWNADATISFTSPLDSHNWTPTRTRFFLIFNNLPKHPTSEVYGIEDKTYTVSFSSQNCYESIRQPMSSISDEMGPESVRCVCREGEYDDEVGQTYAKIQQAAETCRLCDLHVRVLDAFAEGCFPALFQGADEPQRGEMLGELRLWPLAVVEDPKYSYILLSFMGSRHKLYVTRDSEARAFAVEGVSFPYLDPRGSWHAINFAPFLGLPNRTYSDQSLERGKTWLRHCLDHHHCGKSDFYPKRLLDLREEQIRLFYTNDVQNFEGSYVCLSHRWGSPGCKRLISTAANVHNHMKGIPWEEFPRTFQDAIAICKHMSVSYLWIDTLCILQEDDEMSDENKAISRDDFAAENSAMAQIYQSSYFTICASNSTSMDSGIFPSKREFDHRINVTADDGNEASLYITAGHSHNTPPTDLETRGWTFQEYLLPPRILELGPFDISWRCQIAHLCECQDDGYGADWGWRRELAEQSLPPEKNKEEVEKWWTETIRHYTGRQLTKPEDKLPALSGLAQIYHKATGDEYLAGLWKASLPHNLCWYHCSGRYYGVDSEKTVGTCRRPDSPKDSSSPWASRAPTWSWASLDALHHAQCRTWWPGIIDHDISLIYHNANDHDIKIREVCTVYKAVVQPATSDQFGEAAPGGFLELGVTLISAKIASQDQHKDYFWSVMDNFRGTTAWTLNHFNDNELQVEFCLPDCGLPADDCLEVGDEVHCAPILETVSKKESKRGCLVLKRVQGHEYRRVGFCILLKENPNYYKFRYKDTEPDYRSHALQYSPGIETTITIK